MKKTPIASIVRLTAGAACLALVLWSLPGCSGNEDGHDRLTGGVDDVINVAGHRMGTDEVEGALV